MASKRKSDKEGDDRNLEIPVQQSKRRHGDSGQMAIRAIGNLRVVLRISDIASGIGDSFRKMKIMWDLALDTGDRLGFPQLLHWCKENGYENCAVQRVFSEWSSNSLEMVYMRLPCLGQCSLLIS